MRRLIPIAAFALALAVPLWAQHGGGHAGGGHVGGFSGGHSAGFAGHSGFSGGHTGGVHVSGGTHFSPGVSRGFARGPVVAQRNFGHRTFGTRGFRDHRFRNFRFRNNCFGYGCWGGYPWWGYYDPWWWDDNSGSSYDEDYERDRAVANDMNEQSLEQQSEQQRMLREEEADGDQDIYIRSSSAQRSALAAPTSNQEPQGTSIVPPTVLVFRDQHREEVRNYAIVGQTLWNFSPQRTEKIHLNDLDLTSTTKANDDRGVTFRVPTSGEAQ